MKDEQGSSSPGATKIRLERTYPTSAEQVWKLWTTSEGIESWWAPDGFTAKVSKLDLRPGGELIYTFTATAPEQVEFMKNAGMPLTTEAHKTFTELTPPTRIAYTSVVVKVTPVTLPPGRLRLATRPILTGSLPTTKMMGVLVDADLAACAAVLWPTITAT